MSPSSTNDAPVTAVPRVKDDAQNVYPSDMADVRLGQVISGLTAGAKAIREAVSRHHPGGPMRQSLDLDEHPGHWLTRPQVMDASNAASTVERILRELDGRIDPRCKGNVKGSYGPPDGEWCRCDLRRGHEGEHECKHTRDSDLLRDA